MVEIEFSFKQSNIIIQGNLNEKMMDICKRYMTKAKIEINSVYFLYSGKNISFDLTLEQTINSYDKNSKKIKILVYSLEKEEMNNNCIVKSPDIICPECRETTKLNIKDYLIYLYECKNGHTINNLSFDEFEKTQKIDFSKILCNICKKNNKSNTYKNEFYICGTCFNYLCPLCKLAHNKNHNIINYDNKNYCCSKHNELYTMYCKNCKINICLSCSSQHKNHNTIFYGNIMPDIDKIKDEMNQFKKTVDIFKNRVTQIINKLTKVMNNIEIYYNICNELLINYENKKRNYELLQNLNQLDNNNVINDLDIINKDNNTITMFKNILNIYNKMINNNKNKTTNYNFKKELFEKNINNEIKMKLKIEKKDVNEKIYFLDNTNGKYIFGTHYHDFLTELNETNVELYINNNKYKYQKYFIPEKEGIYYVNLKFNTHIKDISHMFHGCEQIIEIDLTSFDSSKTINMGFMFGGCTNLEKIINLTSLVTDNVTNMESMFCSTQLHNINLSYFNTSKVLNMRHMFYNCSQLIDLDLSSFNVNNVNDMEYMFGYCSKLKTINLSSFYVNNKVNCDEIFKGCENLYRLKMNKNIYEQIKNQNNIDEYKIDFI